MLYYYGLGGLWMTLDDLDCEANTVSLSLFCTHAQMTCDLEWPWTTLCLKLDIINVNTVRIIWVRDWLASCQVSSILNYSRQQLIVTLNWPSDDLGLNAIVERDFYVKCRPVQLWLISGDERHICTDAWPSCILWSILSSWPSRSFVSFFNI